MRRFTVLLLLLFSATIQGQIWIDQGATWHYEWSGILPAFDKIEYVGDTVIQQKNCQVLEVTRYVFQPIQSGGQLLNTTYFYNYTHLSNDTLYYLVNGQFEILYCFGAQVGDTWDIGVDTNHWLCGSSVVKVHDTGSTIINGEKYEWIAVHTLSNSSAGLSGKIYKRFGAISDYLFPTPRNCDPNSMVSFYNFRFACFEDVSFPVYNVTNKACAYLLHTGITEIEKEKRIVTLFPNPVRDVLHIRASSGHKISQIEITDIQGNFLTLVHHNEINLSGLSKGVYLVKLEFSSGEQRIEKIVKL